MLSDVFSALMSVLTALLDVLSYCRNKLGNILFWLLFTLFIVLAAIGCVLS